MSLNPYLLVGLGGAVGAMARLGVSRAVGGSGLQVASWPWATFLVNVVGGFLMGLLVGWLALKGGSEAARLLLAVGVLGGFTTFSAFSLEMMLLVQRGEAAMAAGYALVSVVAAFGALAGGLLLARALL